MKCTYVCLMIGLGTICLLDFLAFTDGPECFGMTWQMLAAVSLTLLLIAAFVFLPVIGEIVERVRAGAAAWFRFLTKPIVACASFWLARWYATMDKTADKVKDAIMDWDFDVVIRETPEPEPLPELQPQDFVEAMLPEAQQFLEAMAQQINEAPNAVSISGNEAAVQKLVGALTQRALEIGEKMRVDAAVADLPPSDSGWTEKFRRMHAAQGALSTTDD